MFMPCMLSAYTLGPRFLIVYFAEILYAEKAHYC